MDIPHGWQGDENLDGVQLVSIKTGLTATMGRTRSNELPCESLCEAEEKRIQMLFSVAHYGKSSGSPHWLSESLAGGRSVQFSGFKWENNLEGIL